MPLLHISSAYPSESPCGHAIATACQSGDTSGLPLFTGRLNQDYPVKVFATTKRHGGYLAVSPDRIVTAT
ncbi:MAG: hypothetical protein EG822_06610 [Deltaproteobacteria bacterium]|nr:hypothetical protein [Deltaproteobacteria bacterium]TLN01310.1 MAG: hypothetical protein FDZ73_16380 [bacterium]